MIPDNNGNSKSCPHFTPPPTSVSLTILDISKATGAISPATASTSSIQQLALQAIEPPSPVIASRIYPNETPPTQAQIDIVRYTWERVSEIRHPCDDPNVSASHAFGLAFYDALFEIDPALRPLFTNIFQQARALSGMISYIARAPKVTGTKPYRSTCGGDCALTIREINARKRKESSATTFSELVTNAAAQQPSAEMEEGDPERLLYKLRELGTRHYFYSVQPHQLALIGPAVLRAIELRLGKEFLPEVAEAWTRAHAYAAFHMRAGLEAQTAWEQGRSKSAASSGNGTKSNCAIQ